MSPEWVAAASALATLFVIGVTAYAGLRQIRHMRSGNQVAALLPLTEKYQTAEMQESLQYVLSGAVSRDLQDREIRRGAESIPASGTSRKAMDILIFMNPSAPS